MAQKLFIITGQTGTGKTKLAEQLAQQINGDLVSADARQAYQYLDIVTGKDISDSSFCLQEKNGDISLGYYQAGPTKVWLYDMVNPKKYLSAYDWAVACQKVLGSIISSGKTPIIIGGTYFYINTVLYGLSAGGNPQWDERKKLEMLSVYELRKKAEELAHEDFRALNNSDQYNPRRLVRFIEKHTDNTMGGAGFVGIAAEYDCTTIALKFPSTEYTRKALSQRVDERLKSGAIDEAETLLHMGYTPGDPGLNTIGYKQIFAYLAGEKRYDEMRDEWITKECQYAKRQLTLIKQNGSVLWYNCDEALLKNVSGLI
ncbi:MAG: tRNA (adenosine(37)-N6)-dimethylallyltransferase MiaA [Patescibacteria group bacterium]|jgi:tRNA dimethylallyltransferase